MFGLPEPVPDPVNRYLPWYKCRVESLFTLSARPPVLAMSGEFDMGARDELTAALLAVVRNPATDVVVLDVEKATFIDSEALAAVIIGMNEARLAGKPFRIVGATGVVHRVLDVAGLLDLIDGRHYGP